jgi:hypothetical protein
MASRCGGELARPWFWLSRLERGAARRPGGWSAARRTARPAKSKAATLRWGALAGACTRARVLVHGRTACSSSDWRRGSTLPAWRGAAFRANTCKQTGSSRSPARTHQSSHAATASSGAWIAHKLQLVAGGHMCSSTGQRPSPEHAVVCAGHSRA